MRYDIPAVYQKTDEYFDDVFKYLTLQSPIPKGDGIIEDFSHVTSQYLTELDFLETIWVLPPYNMDNRVVSEDIGLVKFRIVCDWGCDDDEDDDCGGWEIRACGMMCEDIKV